VSGNYRNEYDPLVPNDYGAFLKEQARRRKYEEEEEARKRRRVEEEEEERRRHKGLSSKHLPWCGPFLFSLPFYSSSDRAKRLEQDERKAAGETVAQRMMMKMGWKGGGLGREQQGMNTPLTVEKVGTHQGYIRQDPVALYQAKGNPTPPSLDPSLVVQNHSFFHF